jgi:hypothetical protein
MGPKGILSNERRQIYSLQVKKKNEGYDWQAAVQYFGLNSFVKLEKLGLGVFGGRKNKENPDKFVLEGTGFMGIEWL